MSIWESRANDRTQADISREVLPAANHRTLEIINSLLSSEEIISIISKLDLYESAPFVSFHGLKNCAEFSYDWNRNSTFPLYVISNIYQEEGLLCADLRSKRGALELTRGRVDCSPSSMVDFRSRSVELIRRAANEQGRFPPVCCDTFWGFPSYPSLMFSLSQDRDFYKNTEPEKIPRAQFERGVSEVPITDFIALCLCGKEHAAHFFNAAKDRSETFFYHTPILCGMEYVALPDFEHIYAKDKNYFLLPREDLEAWYEGMKRGAF